MNDVTYIADFLATKAERPAAQNLGIGDTVENDILRMHRYTGSITLWDLTNAGKRGRKVTRLSVSASFDSRVDRRLTLEQAARSIEGLRCFDDAKLELEEIDGLDISTYQDRGVDVIPAGFKTIRIKTARLSLEVGYNDFSVEDTTDLSNCPTCIPEGQRKMIPAFYRWVSENFDRIPAMSYHEILSAMSAQGIRYYDYCAMD
jgi:hypothetical protein